LCCFAEVRVVTIEVTVHNICHVAHILGAFESPACIKFCAVTLDDPSTLSGHSGLRVTFSNLLSIYVTVLVYSVNIRLEASVVGKAWLKSLRSAAAVTATANLTTAAAVAAAATNRCSATAAAAAVATATAANGLWTALLSACETAPTLRHLLHSLHHCLQHKHHLCLLRLETAEALRATE
jgi:hypothetical protein